MHDSLLFVVIFSIIGYCLKQIRSTLLALSRRLISRPHMIRRAKYTEHMVADFSPLSDGAQTLDAKGAAESMSEAVDAEAARRCNELFSGE